jgi:hypothetical protein
VEPAESEIPRVREELGGGNMKLNEGSRDQEISLAYQVQDLV